MEWSYSLDGERFYECCETERIAVACAIEELEPLDEMIEGRTFFVGERKPPTPPEELWRAEDWLEHVACQDEYSHDYADGWGDSTREANEELEELVKPILAAWIERHGLVPQFWLMASVKTYRIVDGKPIAVREGAKMTNE